MHKIIAIASAIFLATTAAYAQVPTSGNIFGGFSYVNADLISGNRSSLNGWNASLEGKVFPFVGIVADFSGNYGSQTVVTPVRPPSDAPACPVGIIITCPTEISFNVTLHQHNFLFGPRVSFSVGKLRPFAHALFGVSHLAESGSGSSASENSFAYALGGGLDYRLMRVIGWRVQADMLQTRFFSTTQGDFRLSTGLVFRF
jgi:opacity protein-like surface antigen